MTEYIICSHHPGAVDFIRAEVPEFVGAAILPDAGEKEVRGKVVAGNLPLRLAILTKAYYAIEFPPEKRPPHGKDLQTADDYRRAGARIVRYELSSCKREEM